MRNIYLFFIINKHCLDECLKILKRKIFLHASVYVKDLMGTARRFRPPGK